MYAVVCQGSTEPLLSFTLLGFGWGKLLDVALVQIARVS